MQDTRKLQGSQVLAALRDIIKPRLALHLSGTRITADEVLDVLGYASLHAVSIEAACQTLDDVASGNRIREVLHAALPSASELQRRLNITLRSQLPPRVLRGKTAYTLALDPVLLPFHTRAATRPAEVLRAQAQAGTHYFHGYASVSIVHHHQRYVLALVLICPQQTMVAIASALLDRVKRLGIRVRRVLLDKEFFSQDVFRLLARRHYCYILPIPLNFKRSEVRRICQGRAGHWDTYQMLDAHGRGYALQVVAVRRQRRQRLKRSQRWFLYAVRGLPPGTPPHAVFECYRQRFGIESPFRQMHSVRARTSSRNGTLRFLLVGLALILVNLYVALRLLSTPLRAGALHCRRYWLSLPRLARLLAGTIEALYGTLEPTIRRPLPHALS
jgi:putative transposase